MIQITIRICFLPVIHPVPSKKFIKIHQQQLWSLQSTALQCYTVTHLFLVRHLVNNKNLCGRDGRTICGPLRVPKSTYVTLAHKRKPKFIYFGCSLVRRCNCKQSTSANGTDGRTDGQTDGQREYDAICGPLLGRRAA